MTHTLSLPDTRQSAWHLSAIQLTGISSLPVLATSTLLLETVQFKNAILTLILGNILLWFIRFGILSMSHPGRKSTLDLSRDYIGHLGSYAIAFALLFSTLAWFTESMLLIPVPTRKRGSSFGMRSFDSTLSHRVQIHRT